MSGFKKKSLVVTALYVYTNNESKLKNGFAAERVRVLKIRFEKARV